MTRTYLVALDGSDLAERVLPYAVKLAAETDGRLVLTRAALAEGFVLPENYAEQQINAVALAELYLSNVADSLRGQAPVEIAVPYGRASTELLRAVGIHHADGIVMATHGRTGLSHLIFGSVAEAVVTRSPVPVYLVRPQPSTAAVATFEVQNGTVLVALDGSEFAEAALRAGVELVRPFVRKLVLTSVVHPPDHPVYDRDTGHVIAYLDQRIDASKRETSDYLQLLAMQLQKLYPECEVELDVRFGNAAEGLVQAAVEHGAALTIMATHGRSGLERMVLGSVAGKIVGSGTTPVLLVRPPAVARVVEPVAEGNDAPAHA